MPSAATPAASRTRATETFWSTANAQMERPHASVPATTNTLRRPMRSDHTEYKSEYKGGVTFKRRPRCTLAFSCNEVPRMGKAMRGI